MLKNGNGEEEALAMEEAEKKRKQNEVQQEKQQQLQKQERRHQRLSKKVVLPESESTNQVLAQDGFDGMALREVSRFRELQSNENKQPNLFNSNSQSLKSKSHQTKPRIQVQSTFVKKSSPEKIPTRAVPPPQQNRFEDEDEGDDDDEDDEIGWSPFVIPG